MITSKFNKFWKRSAYALVLCIGIAGLSSIPYSKGTGGLDFPPKLTPTTPYDVNLAEKKALEDAGKFNEVQRLFEVFSWQMFVALNWPYENGKPASKITGSGEPLWNTWKESYEVYKSDGSKPTPWGTDELPLFSQNKVDDCENILYRTSKFAHLNDTDYADEIDQAFSAPIWDQNGNIVRYEVRMNEVEFDYIVKNELYNLDGQIKFSENGTKVVTFPSGNKKKQGAIEIKLAWKIMAEDDPFLDRYYHRTACVLNPDKTFTEATVGMVGMHISTKTVSSPQWVWATFEHVDNLEVNVLATHNGHNLKPSFYDPNCQTCPINVFPDTSADVVKNQIQRVLPIAMATQALNTQVQGVLGAANSPLQYYQLIGTQWPTNPTKAPYPVPPPSDTTKRAVPEAVINKAGGDATPVYLTNMVMETYFQGATQGTDFNYLIANEPAWLQIEGFPKQTTELIFGTESCVGCHASASIAVRDTIISGKRTAIFGQRYLYESQAIGDFSWLMQLKASFKQAPKTRPVTKTPSKQ